MRTCHVCGCTDASACVDPETGETCEWVPPDQLPFRGRPLDLCTFCAVLLTQGSEAFERGYLEPSGDEPLIQLYSDGEANEFLRERRRA